MKPNESNRPNESPSDMAHPLEGCFAKLDRADTHLQALQSELKAWNASQPYSISHKINPDFRRHSLVVNLKKQFPANRFALIAGDAFHSMRCALDHLVYGIAKHQTGINPPENDRRLSFPIADDDRRFDGAVAKGCLVGVTANVQALIKTLQPRHRPHQHLRPLLAVLRDLDDVDKHRFLNVVATGQVHADLRMPIPVPPKQSVSVDYNEGPLHDGSEAVVITFPIPQPDFKLNMSVRLAVGLEHPPGPSGASINGLWVVSLMLRDEVRLIVELVKQESAKTHPWA